MTTDPSNASTTLSQPPQPDETVSTTPIEVLLNKRVASAPARLHPSGARIDGIVIGELLHINAEGHPVVTFDQLEQSTAVARSLLAVSPDDLGKSVALGFEAGNALRPIILGFMYVPDAVRQVSGDQVVIETSDGRVKVSAETELELRCGDAVILMQADGRITLRGEYITSHASAGQRIRGGSVQIN